MPAESITHDFFIQDKKAVERFASAIDELLELRSKKKEELPPHEYISEPDDIAAFMERMRKHVRHDMGE